MATWIGLMRIADYFMKRYEMLNNAEFLVGNIAPDCGVPNEDWSVFTPGKEITHWHKKGSAEIDAEDFRQKYLQAKDEKYPFYLGYYFHLLTDIAWSEFYRRKKAEPLYAEGLAKDPKFIWTIKEDWYGQDFVFLQKNPDFVFFTVFAPIKSFANRYFDFYPAEAFSRQIGYITEFYLSAAAENREFPYLSAVEMDSFVAETAAWIEREWQEQSDEAL